MNFLIYCNVLNIFLFWKYQLYHCKHGCSVDKEARLETLRSGHFHTHQTVPNEINNHIFFVETNLKL